MKNRIEICNLCKSIEEHTILKDVSITLESGKIYGFVGKNGSGKTMFFRMIAGFVKPSSGEIICNKQKVIFGKVFPLKMGVMIENAGLYSELSGIDNLKYLASIRKIVSLEQIKTTMQKVGLDPLDKRKIKKYSLGMKQRLVFAQAVLETPEVLLLDEPTNALDETGVQLIRRNILEEKERGAIICIASHNAEDIQVLSDEIYEVKDGKIQLIWRRYK